MFEPKPETAAALLGFSCSGSLLFLFTVPLGLGAGAIDIPDREATGGPGPGDGQGTGMRLGGIKMWTCPKCGRAFKRQEQSHYCGKAPETVDEYIAAQPEAVQGYLKEIREALCAALPEAEERISWSMPTYWKGHNIIQFAGFKNHVGLYPGPEAVREFSERLKGYKTSKGTIQLPYSGTVPAGLVSDIARWCYETGNHP